MPTLASPTGTPDHRVLQEAVEPAFLSNFSHELRTPMTSILGFAQIIESEAANGQAGDEIREAARTIRRNGEHLLELISTILDTSRPEGAAEARPMPFSPVQLAVDVVDAMAPAARAKRLGISAVYAGSLPTAVTADERRIAQILRNLVSNAVRYTETGGVKLRAAFRNLASGQGELRFDVIDSGIGMPPAQVAALSGANARAASLSPSCYAGPGLGLHLSHTLAAMLGGRIQVESHLGAGSRFSLILPVEAVEERELVASADPYRPIQDGPQVDEFLPLAGARVLLVEDGPDNQALLRFLLRRAGADVELATDGLEAIEFASGFEADYDLILMDMHMPTMDGYQATRRLRQRGCGLPIIALTAHALEGDRERCLAAGCDDYITKPVSRAALVGSCKRWVLGELARA